jgi:hypothetical protein
VAFEAFSQKNAPSPAVFSAFASFDSSPRQAKKGEAKARDENRDGVPRRRAAAGARAIAARFLVAHCSLRVVLVTT